MDSSTFHTDLARENPFRSCKKHTHQKNLHCVFIMACVGNNVSLSSLQGQSGPQPRVALSAVGTKRSADSMLPGPRQKRQETSKLSSAPASQRSNARLGSLGSLKVKPKVEQSATAVAPGVERLPELWQVSHITFTRHFRCVTSAVDWMSICWYLHLVP